MKSGNSGALSDLNDLFPAALPRLDTQGDWVRISLQPYIVVTFKSVVLLTHQVMAWGYAAPTPNSHVRHVWSNGAFKAVQGLGSLEHS